MKLEDQVASLELCKKLKELGARQESIYFWGERGKGITLFHRAGYTDIESGATFYTAIDGQDDVVESQLIAAAFTVAELGEMLPQMYQSWRGAFGWFCSNRNGEVGPMETGDTEADVRAKMLIHLIESNLIDPKNTRRE